MKRFTLLPFLAEDTGTEIGTGAEETEIAVPSGEEPGAEETEVAEPSEETGKTEADAAFAELRRRAEEAEKRAKQSDEALRLFFEGDDPIIQAHATAENKDVDTVRKEFEERENLERLQTENEELQTQLMNKEVEVVMNRDLAEIKKIDPNVKSLDDLGDDFFNYVSAGLNGVQAYYAIKARQETEQVKTPEPLGRLNQGKEEKDFYTYDEVMAMSSAERTKKYDVIRASMNKW